MALNGSEIHDQREGRGYAMRKISKYFFLVLRFLLVFQEAEGNISTRLKQELEHYLPRVSWSGENVLQGQATRVKSYIDNSPDKVGMTNEETRKTERVLEHISALGNQTLEDEDPTLDLLKQEWIQFFVIRNDTFGKRRGKRKILNNESISEWSDNREKRIKRRRLAVSPAESSKNSDCVPSDSGQRLDPIGIPDDLLQYSFTFLDLDSIKSASRVSLRFKLNATVNHVTMTGKRNGRYAQPSTWIGSGIDLIITGERLVIGRMSPVVQFSAFATFLCTAAVGGVCALGMIDNMRELYYRGDGNREYYSVGNSELYLDNIKSLLAPALTCLAASVPNLLFARSLPSFSEKIKVCLSNFLDQRQLRRKNWVFEGISSTL